MLLAGGTSLDITVNVGGEAQPPKLRGNKLVSFENTWMASSGMIMVSSHDGVAQVGIGGDVNTALVSQDTGIIVPIRKLRAEIGRDSSRESVEGVEDRWV